MKLGDVFRSVALKRLSKVEAEPAASNQHELNGTKAFQSAFGVHDITKDTIPLEVKRIHLVEGDDGHSIGSEGLTTLSFYGASRRDPKRKLEPRVYYREGFLPPDAKEGTLLVLATLISGEQVAIVLPSGSSLAGRLESTFISPPGSKPRRETFLVLETANSLTPAQDLALIELAEAAGLVFQEDPDLAELVLSKFGRDFPSTAEFSAFAREQSGFSVAVHGPDEALLNWYRFEEQLFRAHERTLIGSDLTFPSVDEFLKVALKAHNRRKSRAGHALEHHVAAVMTQLGISFTPQCRTELKKTADFVFPDCATYHRAGTPDPTVRVLAVKTTCKDRWRQVLSEADRVPHKHLLTLETPLSPTQIDEMVDARVQPVLPKGLHSAFPQDQAARLWSLERFIRDLPGGATA